MKEGGIFFFGPFISYSWFSLLCSINIFPFNIQHQQISAPPSSLLRGFLSLSHHYRGLFMFKQSRTPTTIDQQHFIKEMLIQDFQLNNFFYRVNSLQPILCSQISLLFFKGNKYGLFCFFLHWKMKSTNASSLSKWLGRSLAWKALRGSRQCSEFIPEGSGPYTRAVLFV